MKNLSRSLALFLALLLALTPLLSCAEETPPILDAEELFQQALAYRDAEQPDYAQMKEYLEQAAALGHAEAMYVLAYRYALGSFDGEPNYAKAEEWYLKAAELGHVSAMYNLAYRYALGSFDGEPNYAKAEEWYLKAAELGHVNAMFNLGNGYCYGDFTSGVPDYEKAKTWYLKAVEQGHARAMYGLGVGYLRGYFNGDVPDYEEAKAWHLKAAELDYVDAMHYLGHYYQDGTFDNGLPDYNEAVKWYRAAWENGHVKSAEHLIDLFYKGLTAADGTVLAQPNHAQMLQLLEEIAASDAESTYALSWLGWMYAGNSDACEADYPRALEIYTRGAELGSGYCMMQLGLIYEDGRLGTADLVAAETWYVKAVEAGESGAQEALDRVRNTP